MWQGSQVPGEGTLTRSCPFTEKLCTLRSIKSYDSSDSGGVPNEQYDPGKLFHCFVTRALILSNQDDGASPPLIALLWGLRVSRKGPVGRTCLPRSKAIRNWPTMGTW